MKKCVFLKIILIFCISKLNANVIYPEKSRLINDPISDFLTSQAENHPSIFQNIHKLSILELDLDNSGVKSILISCDQYIFNRVYAWTIYKPTKSGYIKYNTILPLDGVVSGVSFSPEYIYLGFISARYGLLTYRGEKYGEDNLILYQFSKYKITESVIKKVNFNKNSDKNEFMNYFGHPPDLISLKRYPITTYDLGDLRNSGYPIDTLKKTAKAKYIEICKTLHLEPLHLEPTQ